MINKEEIPDILIYCDDDTCYYNMTRLEKNVCGAIPCITIKDGKCISIYRKGDW